MIKEGFKEGGERGDLFRGTAYYYSRYRHPYPKTVIDALVTQLGLDGHGRLLDVGCGTGQAFLPLAPYFEGVLAIDADPDMVSLARNGAKLAGVSNVTVIPLRAEEISPALGTFRIALFAASFHWMDRVAVANKVRGILNPGGRLVVVAPGGIHSGTSHWEGVVRKVLEEHLGTERRAGGGSYRGGPRHQEALIQSDFASVETVDVVVKECWAIDDVIGYLYSTSYASKAILGTRQPSFEAELRRSLADEPTPLYKDNVVTIIIAHP